MWIHLCSRYVGREGLSLLCGSGDMLVGRWLKVCAIALSQVHAQLQLSSEECMVECAIVMQLALVAFATVRDVQVARTG